MKTQIKINLDDLIIFQGKSKNNTDYCQIQFRRKVMFNPGYVKQFADAGVEIWGMEDLQI
jgi:hypothetical protein